MYQHLTECETHAENMQISFCFCQNCICLKKLENMQLYVSMIDRLDITDEYSVKCDFILNRLGHKKEGIRFSGPAAST